MRIKRSIITFFLMICCGGLVTVLGQKEDKSSPKAATPNGYAIRIIHPDAHSSYTPMYGDNSGGMTNFSQNPPATAGALAGIQGRSPILLINVYATKDGDGWKVDVAIPKGDRFDEGEQHIATYRVRENERARVNEMSELGASPFDVSVVKITQPEALPPEIVNRANSVAVLGMMPNILPQPFRVKLQNLSAKDVLSLEVDVFGEKKGSYVQFPGGSWDKPLIKAGETLELPVTSGSAARKSEDGYEPEQIRRIEIGAVVFADCNYEGNPYPAALCRTLSWGSLAQLRRLLTLLDEIEQQNSNGQSGSNVMQEVTNLRTRVEALDEEVDPSFLAQLRTEFQALTSYQKGNLEGAMQSGLRNIKITFLKELAEFARTHHRPAARTTPAEFGTWLEERKIYYVRWAGALPQ